MKESRIIRVAAVLSSGLMAGLLFGDWLGPASARSKMAVAGFIQFQQIIHENYLLVLPALSTIAIGAPIIWLIMLRGKNATAEFRIVVCAAIAVVIGYTITLVFNIPVNTQLESWVASAPPADAREIWTRWETAHTARTIFWMTGFLAEIIALANQEAG